MNRNIRQIFYTTVSYNQKNWVEKVPLTEFVINSSISASTGYASFELNGGYMPSMIKEVRGDNSPPQGIKKFTNVALANLVAAHDAIIKVRVFQTQQANKCRLPEPDIKVNNLVYIATKNLNLPKRRSNKLCPKYIGLFRIVEVRPKSSNYHLELLPALTKCKIHPILHISLLRPYNTSNNALFPDQTKSEPYDFRINNEHKWFVDELIGHKFSGHNNKNLEFKVCWSTGDTTWELYQACKNLTALDRYMELRKVSKIAQLPWIRS
ncbi:hypothetical protein AN958_02042 [Leucoagaricus sp. SymC.cos]|nr:hypothetical protein AN958_02042 [Leucoagaricus sp. SymC.cos]